MSKDCEYYSKACSHLCGELIPDQESSEEEYKWNIDSQSWRQFDILALSCLVKKMLGILTEIRLRFVHIESPNTSRSISGRYGLLAHKYKASMFSLA